MLRLGLAILPVGLGEWGVCVWCEEEWVGRSWE